MSDSLRFRWALAGLLAAAGPTAAFAQNTSGDNTSYGTTAAEFLLLGASARGAALGTPFAAIANDVSALYYNPAGIALQRTSQFQASAYDYVAAVTKLEHLSRRELTRWGRDFDVLLTPTSAILPPPAGEILAAQHAAPELPVPEVVASVSFTAFANVTGQPAISLPLQQTADGLPVGVMLTGGPFDEAGLLRLAAQLEAARPWADRVPAAIAELITGRASSTRCRR